MENQVKYFKHAIVSSLVFFCMGFNAVGAFCTKAHSDVHPLCSRYIAFSEGVKESCKNCGRDGVCKSDVSLYIANTLTDQELLNYMKKERLSRPSCR